MLAKPARITTEESTPAGPLVAPLAEVRRSWTQWPGPFADLIKADDGLEQGWFVHLPPNTRLSVALPPESHRAAPRPVREQIFILAEAGSQLDCIEGCVGPVYSAEPERLSEFHIRLLARAQCRFLSFQNWTRPAVIDQRRTISVDQDAAFEWLDCNLGAALVRSEAVIELLGPGAQAAMMTLAFAGAGQRHQGRCRVNHCAPRTVSRLVRRDLCHGDGFVARADQVTFAENSGLFEAHGDIQVLLLGPESKAALEPRIDGSAIDGIVGHQTRVLRMAEREVFYMASRGLDIGRARMLVVGGFLDPVLRRLPSAYGAEVLRFIELGIEGAAK